MRVFFMMEVIPEIMQFVYGWGTVVAAGGPGDGDVGLDEEQNFLFLGAGADVPVDYFSMLRRLKSTLFSYVHYCTLLYTTVHSIK